MHAILEAKLRGLIDRQEIRDVPLRYPRGLDRLDCAVIHFQKRGREWIADRVGVIEHSFEANEPSIASSAPTVAEAARLGPPRPATRDRGDVSYQRRLVPRRPAGMAG